MLLNDFFTEARLELWPKLLGTDAALAMTMVRLDLLDETLAITGEDEFVAGCLADEELQQYGVFTFAKRKTEWLGGRIAAKDAAIKLINNNSRDKSEPDTAKDLVVEADQNGRPLIRALVEKENHPFPDISISHSGNLAVAMAVSRGRCGIDIQEINPSVIKVRERFSTLPEADILKNFQLVTAVEKKDPAVPLSILWAAKEALKKAHDSSAGFLELELVAAADQTTSVDECLILDFINKNNKTVSSAKVLVMLYNNYALALTCTQQADR